MNQSATEILNRLIAFDTVSRNSNLELISWVEEYLLQHDVASHRVYDETGMKANLIATIGPDDVPGIVLSGHTDVVPVDGQPWETDPFEATLVDENLYGRGSSDMKGFCACVLAAVPDMVAAPLETPLHLCFSYDEEVGCIGVRGVLREMRDWPVKPRGCIVGEPTKMNVVIGHKSKQSWRVTVRGKTGHSSFAPNYVNAVEYAARLVVFISDIGRELAQGGARDMLYDVEHSTAHVGMLNGGTQLNIVPDLASFDFEFRTVTADNSDALVGRVKSFAEETLLPEMQAVDPDASIEFDLISGVEGLDTSPDEEIVSFAKSLAQRNDHSKVAFGTEGGLFQTKANIPTVIIGPGDIDRAHKANEYIKLSEIDACSAFINRLIVQCSA